jgi:predicted transcriptional regulator
MNNPNLEIIEKYFQFWNNQDLDGLSSILSHDVKLEDWEIKKTGKSEVLRANKEIYNAVQSICVKIIDLSQSNNGKIFAQLEIKVDEINTICVVDVFEVINLKIHSIQAYKC